MKKILFLTYAALALFALSCTKEEDLPAPSPNEGKTFVSVGGSRELPDNGTKSQMADNGAFSWTYSDSDENNDAILICGYDSSKGKYTFSEIECVGYPDPEEKKNARFSGWVTGTIQDYAVFPATLGASFDGTSLTLNLPNEITWKEGEADNLMVAPTRTYANGVHNFSFYNVAGLFKVTLNGLPSTARKVSFYAAKSFAEETPKKITGNFSINMSAVNVEGTEKVYPQITTETATTDDFVTIKWSDAPAESMVFYVPVPTGEYTGFSFRVKDAEDNVLASFKGKTAKSVTRGKLIILPALTMTTAGGGGDNGGSKLVVPHNYTANNGVFVLPETSSDIELDIESNNEVTIAYSSENAEKKPANVYMTVLGDVNSLTINLPDSHVELGGQVVNNNNYTITNLTSNTSVSTLLVNKTVKIGKSEVEGSGITVTGGSLNLTAPVEGTVKVSIPDNVLNTTEEKVSININSSIQKLDVERAANKDVANKIYVTLAPPTNQTQEQPVVVELSNLTVTETNCNLYVAPGVTVTTATTSAAENTIEGTVTGTLTAQPKQEEQQEETSTVNVTVTGTVANLAATGEGTTVVVEEGATVSQTISSTNDAVVVVVVDENTDAVATVPTSQNQNTENGGAIVESSGQVVAMIGNTTYSSLEAAFAAVTTTDATTITLMSDVTITENNIVVGGTHGASANVTATVSPVNVTFDLNNHNITGTKTIYLVGGSLNITGTGTIETTNENVAAVGVRYVKSTGGLDYTSKRTLTIGQNVTLKGAKYGLNVFGTNEGTVANDIEVNVNGTIKGDLFVLGNLSNQSNTIDINVNGTIDASAVDMNGIALNGYANVTVGANAVVKGNTGIEVRAGRLVVNGGKITATSDFSIESNGSGTSTKGAAVAVSQHTTNLPCSAIISGGTFTGAYALYEKDLEIAPSDNITLSITDGTFNGNIYSEDSTHFISGGTYSVNPSEYVAEGYEAVEGANGYTIQSAGVARIDSDVYASLAAAVEAVPENGQPTTITMLANDAVVSGITIGANKNIVLELNGKTVSGNTDSQTTYALITNKGTLTIQDNTDTQKDGTGTGLLTTYISNADQQDVPGYASNTITNYGTLTVKSGKIVNNGDGYACYAIDNQTNSTLYNPVLTIDGGRMQQMNGYTYAVRMFCNSTTNFNTVTVNGGVIEGGYSLWLQTPNNKANKANLTINGGILNARDGAALYVGGTKADNSNVSIEIKGNATINGTGAIISGPLSGTTYGSVSISGNVEIYNVQCGANVEHFIYGGTYAVEPNSAYIANGYAATQSGNVYTVGPKTYTCNVYTPTTSLSGSLDAPVVSRVRTDETVVNFGNFSTLAAGQVIELTEDVYYNETVSIPAGVVLDFNGHKLTATKVRGLNGNAILQNTLPYNDGQPNMDAYVNVSYEGDVDNVEIRGGTYTFNPQTYTPSGIGVVVDGAAYDAPGLYFVPSIPEALVYYADYNFISTNLGEVTIGYNGSFGKDQYGISPSAGTFVFNDIKTIESINDAFIFQMNPQEEYATSQSYDGWICDYVVSVKEGENGTPENPGLGLWGMYGGMTVGFGIGFDLAANEKYPLISSLGFNFDYAGIKTSVSPFICGTLPFADDLIGKTLYVDLCLFPANGFDSSKVNTDQNYKYIVVERFEYTFAIIGGGASINEDPEGDF